MPRLVVEIDQEMQQDIKIRAVHAKQTIKQLITNLLKKEFKRKVKNEPST